MPTALRGRQPPLATSGTPGVFGIRPLPALSALAVALASVWLLTTADDGGSAGMSASAGLPIPVPGSVVVDAPAPVRVRDPGPTVAGGAVPEGRQAPASAVRQQDPPAPADAYAGTAGSAPTAGRAPSDAASTMYLTIVGDQTVVTWGPAGRRTARVEELLARARPRGASLTDDAGPDGNDGGTAEDAVSGQVDAGDDGDLDRGAEPQQCPRTLPPGSTQADANQLQALYSCRYLSGCRVDDGACTFFYQGRG